MLPARLVNLVHLLVEVVVDAGDGIHLGLHGRQPGVHSCKRGGRQGLLELIYAICHSSASAYHFQRQILTFALDLLRLPVYIRYKDCSKYTHQTLPNIRTKTGTIIDVVMSLCRGQELIFPA